MNRTNGELRKPELLELREWDSKSLPGKVLSNQDRKFVEGLTDSKLSIDERLSGLVVSSKSWVGTVRLSEFEIRIVPKLADKNIGLAKLIDYACGFNALRDLAIFRSIDLTGANLFDLIACMFAVSCEQIARKGIMSDYRETEDTLLVLRGRLLPSQQVLKRFGHVDKIECRHDEYSSNIEINQVINLALSACARRVQNEAVLAKVRRMQTIFAETCDDAVDWKLVKSTITYDRMNDYYRTAHELSWIVLSELGTDEHLNSGSHQTFAFLLEMNALFQKFIERWLREVVLGTDFRIRTQHRDSSILWNIDSNTPYSNVIPDVLIEDRKDPGTFLPEDAKYKEYDEKKLSTSDIYQTFLYAFAFGEKHSNIPTSLILYPSSSNHDRMPARLHVRKIGAGASAQLRAIPIHIPSTLEEALQGRKGPIGSRILELVREVFAE